MPYNICYLFILNYFIINYVYDLFRGNNNALDAKESANEVSPPEANTNSTGKYHFLISIIDISYYIIILYE